MSVHPHRCCMILLHSTAVVILVQEPFPPQAGAMDIITLAGAVLTELHEEELGCMVGSATFIKDLKMLLAREMGYSRF